MLSFYAPKTLQLLFFSVVNFMRIITDVHAAESRPQVIMLTASFFFSSLSALQSLSECSTPEVSGVVFLDGRLVNTQTLCELGFACSAQTCSADFG